MKKLLLLLALLASFALAKEIPASQKPKADLDALKEYAITLGKGKDSEVFVFVDPLCSFSKALMKQLSKNKMAQLSNTYYILLYRLPRLDSQATMEYILQSKNPQESLLEIMVNDIPADLSSHTTKDETLKVLKRIEEVALTLDMQERPYMISFDHGSKYCRVSEGEVACLEELADD
jgi:protein-disulfide isomerase